MARKTKAELVAEYREAQATREAHEFAQYPLRLMAALEEATTKNNFELTVRNGMFRLQDRDNLGDAATILPLVHTRESQDILESLEWVVRNAAEERAEANRVYTAKQAAMSKLTKEEKALLGLI